MVFHHYCCLVSALFDVLVARRTVSGEEEHALNAAWPIDVGGFAREVSCLLTAPPVPSGDPEAEEASLAFYLDPLGARASVDILGVMMLLKTIVRRTSETWAKGLVESVFDLLFDLPTCAKKGLPLLQRREEREEAYSLLEALAGNCKDAFALLGRRLAELHSSLNGEQL